MSYTKFKLYALMESTEALSHSTTLYSRTSAPVPGGVGDWPYITIPPVSFYEQADHAQSLSFSEALWTAPIVENVPGWEDYIQRISNDSDVTTSATIFTYGDVSSKNQETMKTMGKVSISGPGPFTPIHQIYAHSSTFITNINGSMINYDVSSSNGVNATNMIVNTLHHAVVSRLLPLDLIREAYPESLDSTEPLSLFVEPIHAVDHGDTVVAYIQSVLEWQYLFSNIPVKKILCVVKNTCGDSFSYTINGANATYVGMGDIHEKKFDDYSLSSMIGLKDNSTAGIETAKAAGVCIYTLTIYPTGEFRQTFNTHAELYTVVVGIVMFVMVGAFFAYDQYVQCDLLIVLLR
jgi:hypothetical protein